jgi:glycerophosphoryl diester phosphodiesterase
MPKAAALLLAAWLHGLAAAAPIVIAHRGASGYLPEHTLAGYELALRMGADFIEPDLRLTRDGVLVAMHDATLVRTTDAAKRFAPRDGGHRVADFTLAEIKTLSVRPTGTGAAAHAGFTPAARELRVPTFDEVIALAKAQSAATGRPIGLYPEAKQAGAAIEDQILATLARHGQAGPADKVFIQSFDDATLQRMAQKQRPLGLAVPLVLLGHAATQADGRAALAVSGGRLLPLAEVAAFAGAVGVAIGDAKRPLTRAFVDQAHAAGLAVHGWTFAKADPAVAADEFAAFLQIGLDGLIGNYPDLAVRARDAFAAERR